MKTYKHAIYKSPISLPAARSGPVRIEHVDYTPGEKLPVIGMRQAIVRGISPTFFEVDEPLRIHELWHDEHGMWMSDRPEELNQIGEMLSTLVPYGKVVVGGLGLGILALTLAERRGVQAVTVIEQDPNVIKLCARRDKYLVLQDDIMAFIKDSKVRADYYLLDTWQGTSESTWWEHVMPLKRAIRKKWGKLAVIHCWAEDIMWGQIRQSILLGNQFGRSWYYKCLPAKMSEGEARSFFNNVGTAWWEIKFGKQVDALIEMEKEGRS